MMEKNKLVAGLLVAAMIVISAVLLLSGPAEAAREKVLYPNYSATRGCEGILFVTVEGEQIELGAGTTKRYKYETSLFRGRVVNFYFEAKKRNQGNGKSKYVFENGESTMTKSVFLPVLRCPAS